MQQTSTRCGQPLNSTRLVMCCLVQCPHKELLTPTLCKVWGGDHLNFCGRLGFGSESRFGGRVCIVISAKGRVASSVQ